MACLAAGITSNLAALVVRAGAKVAGLQPGHHPGALLKIWAPRAVASYLICGLVAGLLSAWVCFRFRRARESSEAGTR